MLNGDAHSLFISLFAKWYWYIKLIILFLKKRNGVEDIIVWFNVQNIQSN